MNKKTSSATGGIGLDDFAPNFVTLNDAADIIIQAKDLRKKQAELCRQVDPNDLPNLSLRLTNLLSTLEKSSKLLSAIKDNSQAQGVQEKHLQVIQKAIDENNVDIERINKQLDRINQDIYNKGGSKTVEFEDSSEQVNEEGETFTSFGSRVVTGPDGIQERKDGARQREFLIAKFGNELQSDEHGEYFIASPIGKGFGTSPDDQQFVKIYLSKEMYLNGTYAEKFKNLKGSRNLNTKILVSQIDDGSFEAFDIGASLSSPQKKITVATFKDGKFENRKTIELEGDARDAIVDHLMLKMDQKVSKDISELATIRDPHNTQKILSEADTLRVFKVAPKNPAMIALAQEHGITAADMDAYYKDATKENSLQDLLSGKLPQPITVNGKEVTHINQDLMLTPTQQIPEEVLTLMKEDKELFMAVSFSRAVQRSLADHIVDNNQGLLMEEMEKLYGVKDKMGGWLLPRTSEEERYSAFNEKRLKKLNEEYAQLSAFRGVSTLAGLNVAMGQGSSLSGKTGLEAEQLDDIDATILSEDGKLLDSNGKPQEVTPASYFMRRHEEAGNVTSLKPSEVELRRANNQKTSMGVLIDEFDSMKLDAGMPLFGQSSPFYDDKGWTALLSAIAAFGDDTIKALVDDIEKSAEIF